MGMEAVRRQLRLGAAQHLPSPEPLRRLGLPVLITHLLHQLGLGQRMDGRTDGPGSRWTELKPGWKRARYEGAQPLPAQGRQGGKQARTIYMSGREGGETGSGEWNQPGRNGRDTRTLLPPGPLSALFFLCS